MSEMFSDRDNTKIKTIRTMRTTTWLLIPSTPSSRQIQTTSCTRRSIDHFLIQNRSVTIVFNFGFSLTRRQHPRLVPSLFFSTLSSCCNTSSCAVEIVSLFDFKQMQQCTNLTERHHFGKGLRSSLRQQTNYTALLRQTIYTCD